jgi:hypothetical protein
VLPTFSSWNCQLHLLLEDMDLWEIVEGAIVAPIDATLLATHKKSVALMKRILINSVKEHLIPHIMGKVS